MWHAQQQQKTILEFEHQEGTSDETNQIFEMKLIIMWIYIFFFSFKVTGDIFFHYFFSRKKKELFEWSKYIYCLKWCVHTKMFA